jgi:protein-L-isoaspartate(D-aspartate) O-methyltransferase
MDQADLQSARQWMLHKQLQRRGIRDPKVLAAMGKVPRERFLTPRLRHQAYADQALPIECGQTISQPYIVALMTQALELAGHETVLEIGTGSGYQTAVLAELVRQVVSIERHESLSQQAEKVLDELGYGNVTLVIGDGSLGFPAKSPYSRIIVTAAVSELPPALFEQLQEGGILVIPIGGRGSQTLQSIKKKNGRPQTRNLSACRFVPLIGEQGWPK